MTDKNWLALNDYSSKYKVSISTLRRRIKSGRAEHVYEGGKYLLKDAPLSEHSMTPSKPSTPKKPNPDSRVTIAPPHTESGHPVKGQVEVKAPKASQSLDSEQKLDGDHSSVRSCEKDLNIKVMMEELKKAYSMILQEKQEQIVILKEEVSDLRTLVGVLETENEWLKTTLKESVPIDSWLESMDLGSKS